MNNKTSRVSLIKSLNKKQILSLLMNLLTIEELKDLLEFNSKEEIIKVISTLKTREELNDIVNSNLNISTNLINDFYKTSFNFDKNNSFREKHHHPEGFSTITKLNYENENENENDNENKNVLLNEKNKVSKNKLENENKNVKNEMENEKLILENNEQKKNENENPINKQENISVKKLNNGNGKVKNENKNEKLILENEPYNENERLKLYSKLKIYCDKNEIKLNENASYEELQKFYFRFKTLIDDDLSNQYNKFKIPKIEYETL